jgi:hypothetical protein
LVLAALALPTPFLFPDEGAYALLGRGLWHHADLAVLGGPSSYVSALYPVFSALPFAVLRPGSQCQFSLATTSLVHLSTFTWTPA